jgi:Fur family peroxide stress response transcriptional regulator
MFTKDRKEKAKLVIRRNTPQRELVLNAICAGNHPSAREVFDAVSTSVNMSFGTVYRNLQVLETEGEISRVEIDPEVTRYERKRKSHYHLHCRKCGRVFDFPEDYSVKFDDEAEERSGFLIEQRTVLYKGLCRECQKSIELY